MATYYINSATFSAATSVYTDIGLNTLAADGYYSSNDIYRIQTGGILGGILTCTNNTIIANNDAYSAYVTVGINGNNILSNDTVGASAATTTNVIITQLTTSNPSVNINTGTGAVVVATGTSVGNYLMTYKICEIGNIINCDTADVAITINPLPYNYSYNYGATCTAACSGTLTSIAYNVNAGYPICFGNFLDITGVTGTTIYASDTPLNEDSILYSDSGLTTTVSFEFLQLPTQNNDFAVIVDGEIFRIIPSIISCFK